MAKLAIKNEKINAFGGINFVLDKFDAILGDVIDHVLGIRSTTIGYQYSEIFRSLFALFMCGEYDVDFDHQFIEAEKYDAKLTYKHFFGYSPGVVTIGGNIVYLENRDGNANVRFMQAETLRRFFDLMENFRLKSFLFRFIAVPAKWVRTARQSVLNIYSKKPYDLIWAYG